jgi:hypothetical protein
MYVFESFDEHCQKTVDLSLSTMQDSMLAFPPVDEEHQQMMDLHLNVVVNDLAVAVFRSLEARIRESDAICRLNLHALQAAHQDAASHGGAMSSSAASSVRSSLTRIISGSSGGGTSAATAAAAASADEPVSAASRALSLNSLVSLVSPDSKLAKDTYAKSRSGASSPSTSFIDASASSSSGASVTMSSISSSALNANITEIQRANSSPKLITPLDAYWERGGLSSKDVDAIRRRDLARREKWAGDVSLLAGSPLDAYERYLKAAEMCRSPSTPDPLWYASALEGCAAAHIAMAEAGGYGVDEYLESNFSMPEEVVALVTTTTTRREGDGIAPSGGGGGASGKRGAAGGTAKQTLPEVVCALCEEALNITNRHEKLVRQVLESTCG